MTKINNQSNRLDNINFVQDISPESAANYSGGADFVLGSTEDFANVVLHKDPNAQGQKLGINSSGGETINIGLFPGGSETTFNDTVSSITVNEGGWQFFTDDGGRGDTTGALVAGFTYNLGANDDAITSIRRVG
ncbi:MAG: hypothetical protein RLZZ535_2927 [Cyanobacteriota bacterium]